MHQSAATVSAGPIFELAAGLELDLGGKNAQTEPPLGAGRGAAGTRQRAALGPDEWPAGRSEEEEAPCGRPLLVCGRSLSRGRPAGRAAQIYNDLSSPLGQRGAKII